MFCFPWQKKPTFFSLLRKSKQEKVQSSLIGNVNAKVDQFCGENRHEIPTTMKEKIAMISNGSSTSSTRVFRYHSTDTHFKLFQCSGCLYEPKRLEKIQEDGVRFIRIHSDKNNSKIKVFQHY
jgi:hypothetical protein